MTTVSELLAHVSHIPHLIYEVNPHGLTDCIEFITDESSYERMCMTGTAACEAMQLLVGDYRHDSDFFWNTSQCRVWIEADEADEVELAESLDCTLADCPDTYDFPPALVLETKAEMIAYLLATYDYTELNTFVELLADDFVYNTKSFNFTDSYTMLLSESASFYASLYHARQIKKDQIKQLKAIELTAINQAYRTKPVYRINGRFATKSAFIAYCYGKLAILEALVAKLNTDLLKDISNKTFNAVLACLRKLYAAIDTLSGELARLDTV